MSEVQWSGAGFYENQENLAGFHYAGFFPLPVLIFFVSPFVMLFFTLGEADIQLGTAALPI